MKRMILGSALMVAALCFGTQANAQEVKKVQSVKKVEQCNKDVNKVHGDAAACEKKCAEKKDAEKKCAEKKCAAKKDAEKKCAEKKCAEKKCAEKKCAEKNNCTKDANCKKMVKKETAK